MTIKKKKATKRKSNDNTSVASKKAQKTNDINVNPPSATKVTKSSTVTLKGGDGKSVIVSLSGS